MSGAKPWRRRRLHDGETLVDTTSGVALRERKPCTKVLPNGSTECALLSLERSQWQLVIVSGAVMSGANPPTITARLSATCPVCKRQTVSWPLGLHSLTVQLFVKSLERTERNDATSTTLRMELNVFDAVPSTLPGSLAAPGGIGGLREALRMLDGESLPETESIIRSQSETQSELPST